MRKAVRKLHKKEQARHDHLYEAVLKGDAAIERGETLPYSRALVEEIQPEAIERVQSGEVVVNPDVIPDDFEV